MQKLIRRAQRERLLLPAKIIFNNKNSVFDCIVRNVSGRGALLKVVSPLGIPDHFTLFIPGLEKRHFCWIAWRNQTEIGVSFSPLEQNEGSPDLRIVD